MTWWVAGAAVFSSVIGADAAGSAADTQAAGTRDAANATLTGQREALAAQQPFLDAGYAGVNKLMSLLGIGTDKSAADFGSLNKPFTHGDLSQDPGFQFQRDQGQNALDRRGAAGGGFYSGGALTEASAFNQGLAGTTYNDAFNRHQVERANVLNPLQALAGQGQTSANATGQIGMNGANSLAQLITGNANAQGAAGIAGANAISGGINNGLTAWQRAQMFNRLNPGSSPGASPGYMNIAPADSWYSNPGSNPWNIEGP